MTKNLTITFIFVIAVLAVNAQQLTKPEIENSGIYFYGSGISNDENQAREEALREISEQIAVKVSGKFEMKTKETDTKYQETATSIVETYSMATLSEVESIRTMQPDGRIEVFSYVSKESVRNLFDERKKLVYNMFESGKTNEATGKLGFALQNYYFGLVLLKSVPEENITVQGTNLTIEIPKAIKGILQGIHFKLIDDDKLTDKERVVSFEVSYNGEPVNLMQYRFWDGFQIGGAGQVRDGKTTISLLGSSVDFSNLKIYTEYQFYNARKEYSAVEQLWDLVVQPEFDNQQNIDLPEPVKVVENDKPKMVQAVNTQISLNIISEFPVNVMDEILVSTDNFVKLLNQKDEVSLTAFFADDPFLFTKTKDYIGHNNPTARLGKTEAKVNETRNGFEVRKIEVHHSYPTISRQSTEYLVLDFDKMGRMTDFNLCITDDLYEKFVEQSVYGKDWDNRQEIIKFVEMYRTAYLTRDIKTIDLMFAEEALILIGRKIEPSQKKQADVTYQQLPGQPGFEQLQLTKQQYLTRQKQIFDKQKDIFIDFSAFDIMKKNNSPGVYGVEMRQNYSSTTYADEGYLFLLIDFTEKDPLIYIRAWQPNEWDSTALVNTSNFRIYK